MGQTPAQLEAKLEYDRRYYRTHREEKLTYAREYQDEHREGKRVYDTAYREYRPKITPPMSRKYRYGETAEAAWDRGTQQGCDDCGAMCSNSGRPLEIDHDHQTGAVRGIVCHRCNGLRK